MSGDANQTDYFCPFLVSSCKSCWEPPVSVFKVTCGLCARDKKLVSNDHDAPKYFLPLKICSRQQCERNFISQMQSIRSNRCFVLTKENCRNISGYNWTHTAIRASSNPWKLQRWVMCSGSRDYTGANLLLRDQAPIWRLVEYGCNLKRSQYVVNECTALQVAIRCPRVRQRRREKMSSS